MLIGKLNKRIAIEQRSETKDAYGQKVTTWAELVTVWANVRPIGGRERLAAMAYETALTHTVAIRYRCDVLPVIEADALRISFEGRTLQVTAARDLDEMHRFIIFDCIEGRQNG